MAPAVLKIGARSPGRKRAMRSTVAPCFSNSAWTFACFSGGNRWCVPCHARSLAPKRRPSRKMIESPASTPTHMRTATGIHERPSSCASMPAVTSTMSSGSGSPRPQTIRMMKGPHNESGDSFSSSISDSSMVRRRGDGNKDDSFRGMQVGLSPPRHLNRVRGRPRFPRCPRPSP